MLTNSLLANAPSTTTLNSPVRRSPQGGMVLPLDRHAGFDGRHREPGHRETSEAHDGAAAKVTSPSVKISPVDVVKRRAVAWYGMTAEIVQATSHEKIEHHFRAPHHLFAVCEQGVRSDGETFVEGLPRSTLRNLNKKLTFVPAGREYREWQEPRVLSRVAYFYFDPAKMPILSEAGFADLAPRLYFEDAALLNTAFKLTTLIESAGADNKLYLEALGVVLAHELARANTGTPNIQAPVRGGLAAWQQRIVAAYIEEHLAEQISLATLAQLVRLSPYYFCRAFKQSFSVPPHHYHIRRRIERAKALLAKPAPSVTDIGLAVGFQETSSFTAAFRKATGFTPTGYHRSLG
jgi:AraC family transcriptional regulator